MQTSQEWTLAFRLHAEAMGEPGQAQKGAIPVLLQRDLIGAIYSNSGFLWEKSQEFLVV